MATLAIDSEYGHYCCSGGFGLPNVATDGNTYLSSAQKELLLWHWKLGISMQQIQELMRVIEVEEPDGRISVIDRVICLKIQAVANYPIPLCQSCQMLRAKQCKLDIKRSKAVPEEVGALSCEKYETGDFVSLEKYVVKTPGWLPFGYGRESHVNMFHGGCIHVQNQILLGAGETINSKLAFEEWLWETAQVCVKHYHSDNGVFTDQEFCDTCGEEKQTQSFSGVGPQHQNAEAERAIQTIV